MYIGVQHTVEHAWRWGGLGRDGNQTYSHWQPTSQHCLHVLCHLLGSAVHNGWPLKAVHTSA